jgi:outer membrane protein assembly factor BamA
MNTIFSFSNLKKLGVFALLTFLMSSCNTTKYLEEDQYLLKKNVITVETDADEKETGSLWDQLDYQKKQKPNRKWLWSFRARLWLHYKAQEHIESRTYVDSIAQEFVRDTSSFYKAVLKRVSEPPSLYNQETVDKTTESMQYHLNNKGFYDAKVTNEIKKKGKLIKVYYKAVTGDLMRMREVKYSTDDENIQQILPDLEKTSLLKTNAPLESKSFSQEKNRITRSLKNQGYKNFYSNYILYEGDSTNNGTKVEAIILRPTDSTFHQKFHTGKIYVHVQFNPAKSLSMEYDTVMQDGIYFIQQKDNPNFIKKKVLLNSISIQSGEIYQLDKLEKTNTRLGRLGVYKFVSIKIKEVVSSDTTDKNYLDYNIYLTPAKRMSIGFNGDLNYIVGDDFIGRNVLGTFGSITFDNKNIFKGAELLSLKAGVGLEVPIANRSGTKLKEFVSRDLRLQADLIFPQFLDNSNIRITSAFNQISRKDLYDNTSLSLAIGLDHKPNPTTTLSINFPSISYITNTLYPDFIDIVGDDPTYDPQMIIGLNFGLQKTIQNKRSKQKLNLSLNGDFSGVVVNMLDDLIKPETNFTFGADSINYSQYAIFEGDIRYFKTFNEKLTIAARLNGGAGFSFFETRENGIPYIKQFFVGGSNSIRGWEERQIGPGGSVSDTLSFPFFQTGDFKVQSSVELRFGLDRVFSGLEGAVFIDAGNVWNMIGESDTDPTAIRFDNFWKRIAVSAGVGLRVDLSFFMLRFDYAYKLRRTYGDVANGEPDGSFCVYCADNKSFKLSDFDRVRIGIGYPF